MNKVDIYRAKLKSIYYDFRRWLSGDSNIYLIYTMGKVGSSSIYESLKLEKPYSLIYHVHFLSNAYLDKVLPATIHESLKKNHRINRDIAFEVLRSIRKNSRKRLKIITLTREPIGRSVSNLFQNWEHLYEDLGSVTVELLKNHLASLEHYYTLNWFDDEFKQYLNYDIYSKDFDRDKGYQVYKEVNFDILCVQIEKLNNVWDIAIKEFLNEDIKLINANLTENKKEFGKYEVLKKELKIQKQKLDNIYNSTYLRHFYSHQDILKFKKKWQE